jgi:spore germination protein GerM
MKNKQMKSKWIKLTAIIMAMFLAAALGGCSLTGKDMGNTNNNNGAQVPQDNSDNQNNPPVNPQPNGEEVEITLYFGDDQAMYVKPEKRTVEKGSKTMGELLIQELIKGPYSKDLYKTIPDGTRLISLEVADGVAYANFSKEIKTKHWGGSAGEAMTVQSVVHTLAQLPEIDKVQFLIEGAKEEAIWGHGITDQPIAPNKDMVKN